MNASELGQRIKAKYPQYANVPDDDLGQRISAKYPQYKIDNVQQADDTFSNLPKKTFDLLANPKPEQMAVGGIDPVQRVGQNILRDIYNFERGKALELIPDSFKENVGRATKSAVFPPSNLTEAGNKEIGEFTSGLGIDALSDFGTTEVPKMSASASKGIGNLLEEAGGRFMNFYIKPRQAAYSFGRNPGKAVVKHIGPTMSRENLLSKVSSKKDELLMQLEDAATKSNQPVDATPILEEIASTVKSMQGLPNTYKDQIDHHMGLAEDIINILRKEGTVDGDRIFVNPSSAIRVKRALGELPSWAQNDPKLGSISKTARKAYGRFDREIDKSVPGSKELNDDVSNLIGAQKGIELGAQRTQNQDPLRSLSDMLSLGLGASVGGVPGAATGYAASRVMRSVPFNTTVGSVVGTTGKMANVAGKTLDEAEKPLIIGELIKKLLSKETKPKPTGTLPNYERLSLPKPQNRLGSPQGFEMVPENVSKDFTRRQQNATDKVESVRLADIARNFKPSEQLSLPSPTDAGPNVIIPANRVGQPRIENTLKEMAELLRRRRKNFGK